MDWFQIGKGVCQGCILSPCLFNLHAEHIMQNAGLNEAQTRFKIAGRTINKLRYAEDNILMAESEVELRSLLMKVKEESEKASLNLNSQKPTSWNLVPSSWQIQGEKWKPWQILFSWALKSLDMVTAAMKLKDTCYLEEKL